MKRSRREEVVQESAWTSEHNHEIALLRLACSRTDHDASAAGHIRSLARQPLDWQWLAGAAENQGVFPLLYHAIKQIAPGAVPAPGVTAWHRQFCGNAARNLYLARTLSELWDMFESNGIRALAYKGPVLAVAVYGNITLRKAGDLDLLVHRRDFRKAEELLFSRGYRTQMALAWKGHLVHQADGIDIDLHREVVPRWYNYRLNFDELWNRRTTCNVGGKTLATLSLDDLLIVLCLDVVKDTAEAIGLRLLKFCDMIHVLQRYNSKNWELLLEKAGKIRARRAFFVALRAADDLLGVPMPAGIRNKVFSSAAAEEIARRTVSLVRDGPPTRRRFPHQTPIILKVREHPKDKLLVMLRAMGRTFSEPNLRARLTSWRSSRE